MDTRIQRNPKASKDEWYTPKWIIDLLGPFDLDPCAPMTPMFKTAEIMYNKVQDGLKQLWPENAVVWLNPPYSKTLLRAFVEKMTIHNNGIAILINRQDNLLFQNLVFPVAKSMIFMRHRVKFIDQGGTIGHPFFGSCLVAFGKECDLRLKQSGIEGKYVKLND